MEMNTKQQSLMYAIVSMDITLPFYADMGLILSDSNRFFQKLRTLILESRNGRIPESDTELQRAITALNAELVESVDAQDANTFEYWKKNLYSDMFNSHANWRNWQVIFNDLIVRRKFPQLLKQLTDKYPNLVNAYTDITDMGVIEGEFRAKQLELLSTWDLIMFTNHEFNFENEYHTPFRQIGNTVALKKFLVFFTEIVGSFSDEHLEYLNSVAKEILQKEYPKYLSGYKLYHPKELLINRASHQ